MNKKHKRVVHVCKFYPPEKGGIEYVSEQYVNFYKSLKYKKLEDNNRNVQLGI